MMKWLKKLFGKKPIHVDSLDLNPFPRIDKDEIRQQVRLHESATIDGSNEVPESSETKFSNTENRVRQAFIEHLKKYEHTFCRERDAYIARRTKAVHSLLVDSEELKEQAMVDSVVAGWKQEVGPISTSGQDLRSLGQQLLSYRAKHDLLSWLPDCKEFWSFAFFLIIVFAIEMFATVFLLRETGGLMIVLIISGGYCLLNCILPFSIGPAVRNVNYKHGFYLLRRIFGLIVIIALIIIGFAVNLLMGHYRSAGIELSNLDTASSDLESLRETVQQVNNVGVNAYSNFVDSPFGIVDALSWLLFAVGLFAFFVSLWDGYIKDDVYPGYGKRYKAFRKQLERYDEDVEDLIDELDSRRREKVDAIVRRRIEMKENLGKVVERQSQVESLARRYQSACETLNQDYCELIGEYQARNASARKSPKPEYFGNFNGLQIEKPFIPELEQAPSEADISELTSRLNKFSNRLNSEYDKLTREIKPSNDLLDNDPLRISSETI